MFNFYQKASYHLRRTAINISCRLGGRFRLLRDKPGSCILLYHGIDTVGRLDLNARFLSIDRFEQQIRYLKSHFNIVSLNDYFNDNIDSNRFNVAITFDDGYQNNLDLALPVLEHHQAPATFFLTSINSTQHSMLWPDYLDLASFYSSENIFIDNEMFFKRRGHFINKEEQKLKTICKQKNWLYKQKIYTAFKGIDELIEKKDSLKVYWQQLDPEAIRKLDSSPWAEIGVHGYVHDNLGHLTLEEAIDNLQKAKNYLESIVGHSIFSLAYPDGSYTRPLLDAVQKMGFKEQYAVDYLFDKDQKDKRIINRLTINPFTSLDHQIYAILTGKY